MEIRFSRTQGLDEAKSFLSQALASGKFPHALLVHGAAGMGQYALLLDLADILICEDPARKPCGTCSGCLGRKRDNLDNIHFVMPLVEKSEAGDARSLTPAQIAELTQGIKSLSQDPYGFALSEKGFIRIAQITDLQGKISYSLSGNRAKIAIFLNPENMIPGVFNSFLKTLEEPPPNTYFLLGCEGRSEMPATILSRCTQLPLFPMTPDDLRAVVAAKSAEWDLPSVPDRLLPFAEGSPGALLALHRNGGDTLIGEAGDFLRATAAGLDARGGAGGKAADGWLAFADYAETAKPFEDMHGAAPLLLFLLRAVRLFHRLRAMEGPSSATGSAARESWTRTALERQGLDPSLADALAPLAAIPDLKAFTAFLEGLLAAVRDYAKPKNAALGLYLEYLQEQPVAAGA